MATRQRVMLFVVALLMESLSPGRSLAQVDQAALAQKILSDNALERSRALEAVGALGTVGIGVELRAALVKALEREDQVQAQRYYADLHGESLAPQEDPEFIAKLSRVVSELHDPQAIPALVGALGTGSSPIQALVAFGDHAVPTLLAAVRARETTHYVVDDALLVLRFLAQGAGPRPLSAEKLNDVRIAAEQRLSGRQYFTTLWRAIDLAVVLNDPDLKRIVKSLATDRASVRARGIDDPETIEETQRRAADRLAGVPPKPRRP